MPQASDELRAKFPNGDHEALTVVDVNFHVSKDGIIFPKTSGYKPTDREQDAICYLVYEWDYGYDHRSAADGTDR